jgi:hypothetical protein
MSEINRSMDVSERKDVYVKSTGALATGSTIGIFIAPYPCKVRDIYVAALGLSGAPTLAFPVNRVAAGGVTALAGPAATLTVQAVGTSGPVRASLAVAGSSLLLLQTGDVMYLTSGAANAALVDATVSVVVEKLQDIVSHFNVSS